MAKFITVRDQDNNRVTINTANIQAIEEGVGTTIYMGDGLRILTEQQYDEVVGMLTGKEPETETARW